MLTFITENHLKLSLKDEAGKLIYNIEFTNYN